jgi:ABC-type Fe3+ transport system permease subunit
MRLTDMFLAFPGLILAMAIAATLGPGLFHALIALSLVWWPSYARLVRGQFLTLRSVEYVEAARALGSPTRRIMWREILPNAMTPLVVQITLDLGYAILSTSGLSFIGLGVQAPTPEWGAMIAYGRSYMMNAWWYSTFPGLAVFLTVPRRPDETGNRDIAGLSPRLGPEPYSHVRFGPFCFRPAGQGGAGRDRAALLVMSRPSHARTHVHRLCPNSRGGAAQPVPAHTHECSAGAVSSNYATLSAPSKLSS